MSLKLEFLSKSRKYSIQQKLKHYKGFLYTIYWSFSINLFFYFKSFCFCLCVKTTN